MGSCPNCGFDLTAAGNCPVCGYQADRDSERAGTAAPHGERKLHRSVDSGTAGGTSSAVVDAPPPNGKAARLRLPLVAALVVAVVLIGIGGYFLFAGARANSAAGTQPAAAAQGGPTGSSAQSASGASSAATSTEVQGAPGAPQPPTGPAVGSSRGAAGAPAVSSAAVAPASPSGDTGVYSDAAVERVAKSGTGSAEIGGSKSANPYANAIDLWPPKAEPAAAGAAASSAAAAGAAAEASAPAYDITKRTEYPPLTSEDAYVKWMLDHYPTEQEKYLRERWNRARIALRLGHITHERILMGFLLTPREWFTRAQNVNRAYENVAMPIGYGQTISGPDLVARMTDYLNPQPEQRVLEIGTGSGYQSAFLSELSNHVFTIEIVKPLAEETNKIYVEHTKELPEYANIHRRIADGYYGWPQFAPFDRIIVTCGIDHIPPDLLKELKPGGIMVIPIGPPSGQTILKITKNVDKDGNITLAREDIYHGTAKDIFVPFTAEGGGRHSLARDIGN